MTYTAKKPGLGEYAWIKRPNGIHLSQRVKASALETRELAILSLTHFAGRRLAERIGHPNARIVLINEMDLRSLANLAGVRVLFTPHLIPPSARVWTLRPLHDSTPLQPWHFWPQAKELTNV